MRNLKRALSLALASVMLLGMMVVGAGAASYPDVDDADNVEAIEVLNAVKVMIGDHGNFNPDKAVNRHEMAAIMARLVLGPDGAENYVGTHPFTDVYPWADKYVAACYENGLVNGTSATTFGGSQPLTAVQAAAMMLRALGYKDLSKGASDWRAPVTAAANRIRLFADVASNPSEQLTRNQVAQLALNTLKSPMVDTKEGLSITGSNGDLVFTIDGNREYVVRSSTNYPVSGAIMRTEVQGGGADGLSGYALELGEHLYNGKLRLTDEVDDFGRPSRQWEYDGKTIGTYVKEELIRATYVEGVKGGKIYTDIGSEACGDNYSLDYWVDGVKLSASATATEKAKLERRNDVTVGPANGLVFAGEKDDKTDRGVLTQVFVNTQDRELTITEIHTFLAQAITDYDTKNERVSIQVYTGRNSDGSIQSVSKRLEVEDFPSITGLKKDDYVTVTMAGRDRSVIDLGEPTVVSDAYVSAYSSKPDDGIVNLDGRLTKVTADSKEYKISAKAYHDPEYLYDYSNDSQQLDGYRYDLLLDSYGNLLGIKNVTAAKNVFFVVGYERSSTYWGDTAGKAFVIFPDGTSGEINVKLSDSALMGRNSTSFVNTWCDYTVDANGLYTIDNITNRQFVENRGTTVVDSANTTMAALTSGSTVYTVRHDTKPVTTAPTYVYGNDASVYIAVKLDAATGRIDEVNGVTTGIKSANITPNGVVGRDLGNALTLGSDGNSYNVFGLYDKNGYVTYSVVIGEGDSANNLVYLASGITGSYYDSDIKKYVYQYDAITADSDEVITLNSTTRVDTGASQLAEGNLYKASYDAKGFVTKMEYKVPGGYNTTWYKNNGYGLMTITDPTADGTNVVQKLRLSGNTLYLNPNDNNQYVLITNETKFFVNGDDDTDGEYNLYPNATAALAALGEGNELTAFRDGTGSWVAQFAAICDKSTGYAKVVILLDQVYEQSAGVTPTGDVSISNAYIYRISAGEYSLRVHLTNTDTVNAHNIDINFTIYNAVTGAVEESATASGSVAANTSVIWDCAPNAPYTFMYLRPGTYYAVVNGQRTSNFSVS